jgi:hypothetical protein
VCKRNTEDPLVRAFLDRYGLHLLAIPREHAAVGDLYVSSKRGVAVAGRVEHLLEPPLAITATTVGERLADVAGLVSLGVSVGAGLGLLEGFLTAFGAAGLVGKARASFESKRTRSIRFRFQNATRDSTDVLAVGRSIWRHRFPDAHGVGDEHSRYYLATAVARTPSLTIRAETETGDTVKLDVEAAHIAGADTNISVTEASEGDITFAGDRPLAFGVELHELVFDEKMQALKLKDPPPPMRVRGNGADERSVRPAFIGGEDGDVLLQLAD